MRWQTKVKGPQGRVALCRVKIQKDPRKRQNPNLKHSSSGLLKKKKRVQDMMKKLQEMFIPSGFLRRRFDSSWVYVQAVSPSTLRERLKKPKLLLCVVPRPQTMEEPTLGFTKGRVWVLVVISTALDQTAAAPRRPHRFRCPHLMWAQLQKVQCFTLLIWFNE